MYKKILSIALLISISRGIWGNELEIPAIDNIESSELRDEVKQASDIIEDQEQVSGMVDCLNNSIEIAEVVQSKENLEVSRSINSAKEMPQSVEHNILYSYAITPTASKILNGLSEEAHTDFNNFTIELGKALVELKEVEDFIIKHKIIYDKYKEFKGELPKISVDFFMLGSGELEAINSEIEENKAKFAEILSDEDKVKFEEAKMEISRIALDYTLRKISTCTFGFELANIDTKKELWINVHID